jgi:poly(A) polymerase
MSQPKPPKQKMATIREVYDRILWDDRLDHRLFRLGFSDRISGSIREKLLSEWTVGGDIPWHRIRYVKCQEIIVWDRDRAIDLFTSGTLPDAAWASATTNDKPTDIQQQNSPNLAPTTAINKFKNRYIYQYDRDNWQPFDRPLESVTATTLKIASFNVLSDCYYSEHTQTDLRIPIIIEHLDRCDADIIALQEVTPRLLAKLLTADWVRNYYISESPQGETLETHGLLLLSRLPFTAVEYRYSSRKRVIIGKWLLNGKTFHAAAVHFTSDYNKDAQKTRAKQLAILLAYLQTQPGDSAIVGDFNAVENQPAEILTQNNYIDVWQKLHPEDPGYTFNPETNPLAALMSRTGLSGRLDRMVLKSCDRDWLPQKIELFACNPLPDTDGKIYPSDHFGILTQLESAAFLQTVEPVYRSAIAIVPPDEILPAIQAIRQRFDRHFHRWMPHINLLYGFLPEAYFPQAVEIISQALTKLEPFTVTLSNFETFTHSTTSSAWLKPISQPADALHELQSILEEIFPQCNEQSNKSANGFTPHLTVGQFATPQAAKTQLPQWHPIKFTVDSIVLLSRRDREPCEIRYRIHLTGKNPAKIADESNSGLVQIIDKLAPKLSATQAQQQQVILSIVTQACQECLGCKPLLQQIGSARLGIQISNSDLDLLCIIPIPLTVESFLQQVQNKLAGLCERSQLVTSARVPVLRMKIEGIAVDLLAAATSGPPQIIEPLSEAARPFFDPISWSAAVGVFEADLIIETVSHHLSWDVFINLLKAVRLWAKARKIHGNAWGFIGNFSWTLLTAWTAINCNNVTPGLLENNNHVGAVSPSPPFPKNDKLPDRLLANFFQILSQHDWRQPIALTEAGKQYPVKKSREWLPVITSIEPCQNSSRNVTRSTAATIQSELNRGAEIAREVLAGNADWTALFEPVDLSARSQKFLVLTISSEGVDNIAECAGWIEGNLIGLAINLEQKLNIDVIPWPEIQIESDRIIARLGVNCNLEENARAIELFSIELLSNEFIDRFHTAHNLSNNLIIELRDRAV